MNWKLFVDVALIHQWSLPSQTHHSTGNNTECPVLNQVGVCVPEPYVLCVYVCVSVCLRPKCQLLYRSLNVDKRKHFQSQRSLPIRQAIREDQAICAGLICGHITRHDQHMQSGYIAVSPNCAKILKRNQDLLVFWGNSYKPHLFSSLVLDFCSRTCVMVLMGSG